MSLGFRGLGFLGFRACSGKNARDSDGGVFGCGFKVCSPKGPCNQIVYTLALK